MIGKPGVLSGGGVTKAAQPNRNKSSREPGLQEIPLNGIGREQVLAGTISAKRDGEVVQRPRPERP